MMIIYLVTLMTEQSEGISVTYIVLITPIYKEYFIPI